MQLGLKQKLLGLCGRCQPHDYFAVFVQRRVVKISRLVRMAGGRVYDLITLKLMDIS